MRIGVLADIQTARVGEYERAAVARLMAEEPDLILLPGLGPPVALSGVPRSVGAGGLHELDGVQIYVGRGVGCERGQAPQIRFLRAPEITVIELR